MLLLPVRYVMERRARANNRLLTRIVERERYNTITGNRIIEETSASGRNHDALLPVGALVRDRSGFRSASSFTVHTSFPVFASNARKRASSVAPTKMNSPAVAIVPSLPGRPVFRFPSGKLSVTHKGTMPLSPKAGSSEAVETR
jgi:hypothetical protein